MHRLDWTITPIYAFDYKIIGRAYATIIDRSVSEKNIGKIMKKPVDTIELFRYNNFCTAEDTKENLFPYMMENKGRGIEVVITRRS